MRIPEFTTRVLTALHGVVPKCVNKVIFAFVEYFSPAFFLEANSMQCYESLICIIYHRFATLHHQSFVDRTFTGSG